MYRIVKKRVLNPTVSLMEIEAPAVARKAEPGQFIILRVDEEGERIPLTIADFDRKAGTVTIIYQVVGATTEKLNHKQEGEFLQDFVVPWAAPPRPRASSAWPWWAAAWAPPSPTLWRKSSTTWAATWT